MKKKILITVAVAMLISLLAICLAACNPFKWKSVGGGEPNAEVLSQGGYVVQQGKYLYYINGYAGTDADNTWGTPVKQSLTRCELDQNGNVVEGTHKVVVPKLIFNATTEGGFAIFGEWIYYATTNDDKDKNGTASTTNMDFMRTKIDGSVTQLLGRISNRSARYIFTKTRVLYYLNNTVSYIDFSKLNGKPNKNGKGTSKGDLLTDVSSLQWAYGLDKFFYTQTISGNDSYKHYNELCEINYDGGEKRTLATQTTFMTGEDPALEPTNVFQYSLQKVFVEEDGSATIYYTKSYTLDSTAVQMGLFMANVKASTENIATGEGKEKQLNNANSSSATLYPLGYGKGAIVSTSNGNFLQDGNTPASEGVWVTGASQTVWNVIGDYAYYSASSPTEIFKVKVSGGNSESVLKEGINSTFMVLDFIGTRLYFFSSDDDNYLHTIDLLNYDAKDEDGNLIGSVYIGFEREEEEA